MSENNSRFFSTPILLEITKKVVQDVPGGNRVEPLLAGRLILPQLCALSCRRHRHRHSPDHETLSEWSHKLGLVFSAVHSGESNIDAQARNKLTKSLWDLGI